jgi:acyl-CoA reductase-like NAD-dependent aldehyde dehydrogenase
MCAMTVAESTHVNTSDGPKNLTQPRLIVSTNPATGEALGEVRTASPADVRAVMEMARLAQGGWAQLGLKRRLALIRNLKNALYRNMDLIVDTLVAEQGRPPFEAMVEFWPTIELLAYYLRNAERILAPRRVFVSLVPHRVHRIEHRPFGVVLVIAPWNFPLFLSLTPIAAALIAGNTVIYKPSEFATRSGEVLAKVIKEAGIPRDVFQIVHGEGDVGAALIREKPDKICFTGSVATGRKIAAAAGELLIPVTLELGGKDAAIVLDNVDVDRAAAGIAWSGMINAGQVCASVERVYVLRSIADRFVERLAKVVNESVRVGPGNADGTTMGAITTDTQLRIINSQVQEAVAQGAKVVVGGHVAEDKAGRFYVPTVITDVTPEMRVATDETFGPVILVVPVDSEEEALRLANSSNYGLTGSVWTGNRARGLALARQMQAGSVGVNDHLMSASVPNLPWGGVKDSGYGRTRGREGLLEMTYTQSLSTERLMPLRREFFWYPYTKTKLNLLRRVLRLLYGPTWGERLRALLP